jgi:4-hydroxy-tetrahydrodipicolinate synthase
MKNPIFTGAAVAIITPMNQDGSVNYDEFAKFIDFQIENGTDAIVVCGTTGESSTLKVVEHNEAIKWCVNYVNHRIPVIAGTGSNSTACAIDISKEASVDLLLTTQQFTMRLICQLFFTMFHQELD